MSLHDVSTSSQPHKFFDKRLDADAVSIDTGDNGVPQGFDVLEIWCLLKVAGASTDNVGVRFNNDSASTYTRQYFQASTSTSQNTDSHIGSGLLVVGMPSSTTPFSLGHILIPGYSDSTIQKIAHSIIGFGSAAAVGQRIITWPSTAAISRVGFFTFAGENILTGSRVWMNVR